MCNSAPLIAMRFRGLAGLLLFAGVLAACGNAERAEPERRPSHVEALDMYSLPVWTLEEEFRIGSLDDPDVGFSQPTIGGIRRDGTFFVMEHQDLQVRAYDTDGQPVWRVGRRGDGPGEFRAFNGFGLIGDTIWVMDRRRVSLFDGRGRLLETRVLPDSDIAVRVAGVAPGFFARDGLLRYALTGLLPDGSFLATRSVYRQSLPVDPGVMRVDVPLLRIDSRGQAVDTIGYEWGYPFAYENERGGHFLAYPVDTVRFQLGDVGTADVLIVELPEQVLDADGRTTTRIIRIADGDTVFARTVSFFPTIKTREQQLEYMLTGLDSRRASELRNQLPTYPEIQPPVHRFGLIQFPNSVWLACNDPRQHDEPAGIGQGRWLVVDLSAGPVALAYGGRGQLVSHDGERFWAVVRDEPGEKPPTTGAEIYERQGRVPFIARYRVNREPIH